MKIIYIVRFYIISKYYNSRDSKIRNYRMEIRRPVINLLRPRIPTSPLLRHHRDRMERLVRIHHHKAELYHTGKITWISAGLE